MGVAIRVEKLGKNPPLVVILVWITFRVVRHDYTHHLTVGRSVKTENRPIVTFGVGKVVNNPQ